MNQATLKKELSKLEDGTWQFKLQINGPEQLAAEMATFANAQGGRSFIGVKNDDEAEHKFKATVKRKGTEKKCGVNEKSSEKSSEKTENKIFEMMRINKKVTIAELAKSIGISTRAVEKQISALKENNRIKRIGPDKGGYWEVLK